MKKFVKIFVCFLVVIVLVTICIVPSFAYYESFDTQLAQNANNANFPIRFSRASVIAYDGGYNTHDQVYDTDVLSVTDLPIDYNTKYSGIVQTKNMYDEGTEGMFANGYSAYYTEYKESSVGLGVNMINNSIANSSRQRLDLYADYAFILASDLEKTMEIILNDVSAVERSRVTYTILYPVYDSGSKYDYIRFDKKDVTYDLVDPTPNDTKANYNLIDPSQFPTFHGEFSGQFYILTDIRYTAIVERYGGPSNPNDDLSFYLNYDSSIFTDTLGIHTFNARVEVYPIYEQINFEDVSLVKWLTTNIDDFFEIEIFGSITIGSMVWFGIGLALFFFVLKLFMGG